MNAHYPDNERLDLLWKRVIEHLEKKLGNSRDVNIWIKPVRPTALDQTLLTLEIPGTTFQKGFSPFIDRIKEAFVSVAGFAPDIEITYAARDGGTEYTDPPGSAPDANAGTVPLNSDYTFENFVVGPCNRLAHAAALAVGQSPGTAYNPLFIYGGVGLGKTHLMQAMGHVLSEHSFQRISYTTCELFVNRFIQSIQHKTISAFRSQFRNLDILLIDDIQFLSGKEGTQEEFFHTFNSLYNQRKQIVLSSDRPPQEIPSLERRLVSRFAWGLVVDLQPPDFETRVAILKKKSEKKGLALADDIIFYIADNVKDNVRLLEGVLNRIVAYTSLLSRKVDKTLAEEVIEAVENRQRKPVTLDLIIDRVSAYFQISPEELKGARRTRNILIPRQIAMYLAREMTGGSLTSIAERFHGKDHTTVLNACKKIKKLIAEDSYTHDMIERVKKSIEE